MGGLALCDNSTSNETSLWGISWESIKEKAKALKDKVKAKISGGSSLLSTQNATDNYYECTRFCSADIECIQNCSIAYLDDMFVQDQTFGVSLASIEVSQSSSTTLYALILLVVIAMFAAAGALYIKSKKSKASGLIARPSEMKRQIKQSMIDERDQEQSFVIEAQYDKII
jgi:hypothetical protein